MRVGNELGRWFKVKVGLRQGCVMSPWLFNLFMDGVVREVNVRILGKGLEDIKGVNGSLGVNQLLFADDTALVAESESGLKKLVEEF